MSISSTFDRLHSQARKNRWLWLFTIFCRVSLAFGFLVAGMVKVMDERFASGLDARHPMGHYLTALHLTGSYYWFIGVAQIAASIFLLIPRTVTLGAFIYFPIILNITVLTYATRFDGSFFTAPLMTLANLFLLGWNYEKWKYILPFNRLPKDFIAQRNTQPHEIIDDFSIFPPAENKSLFARFRLFIKQLFGDKFPFLFFAGVFASVVFFVLVMRGFYSVMPHNTYPQCIRQFNGTNRVTAGESFCGCIHNNGEPLNKCLNDYNNVPDDALKIP